MICRYWLGLGLCLVTGCASNAGLERDLNSLRTEMASLRAREGALSERLEALERAQNGKALVASTTTNETSDERPELKVVRLKPPASEQEDPLASETRIRIRSTNAGLVEEETTGPAKEASGAEFKLGKSLFEKKSWDGAIAAFTTFIAQNPRDPNLAEATHLRAMAYSVKNDPSRAAEQFEAVVESYPDSPFAPDALLELARVREKLGDKAAADRARTRLKSDYPKSAAAKKLEKR